MNQNTFQQEFLKFFKKLHHNYLVLIDLIYIWVPDKLFLNIQVFYSKLKRILQLELSFHPFFILLQYLLELLQSKVLAILFVLRSPKHLFLFQMVMVHFVYVMVSINFLHLTIVVLNMYLLFHLFLLNFWLLSP